MDVATARVLTQLTSEFYRQVAPSFSQTRQAPWPGWSHVLDACGLGEKGRGTLCETPGHAPLRVLDLACGNLRFERFLAEQLRSDPPAEKGVMPLEVLAFDNCDALALEQDTPAFDLRFSHLDVCEALFGEQDLPQLLGADCRDLSVCFGFFHHLPLAKHRLKLLQALLACTRPGGYVAVSFWQLSQSEKLLAKAQATTQTATGTLGLGPLGKGDYLLGWQDRTDVWRFCHDFSEDELDELCARCAGQAREVTRFSADGKTGTLNRYLVLQAQSG